jgi:hypothetical protein
MYIPMSLQPLLHPLFGPSVPSLRLLTPSAALLQVFTVTMLTIHRYFDISKARPSGAPSSCQWAADRVSIPYEYRPAALMSRWTRHLDQSFPNAPQARKELGYTPLKTFEQGMAEARTLPLPPRTNHLGSSPCLQHRAN